MPSNDTPPRPFVPKTEAERESVKALAAETAIETVRLVNGDVYNETIEMAHSLAQKIVPKVPRVKRRVELHGNRSVSLNGIRGDGSVVYFVHDGDNHGCAEFHELILQSPVIHRVNVAKALIDVLHAPDEPAQPAAAQGGAWPMLNWEQWNEVRESYTHAARMHGDDTAHEHAQHTMHALLGAVPVGRAYPVIGYEVLRDGNSVFLARTTTYLGEDRALREARRRVQMPNDTLHILLDGGLAPTVTP